MVSQIRKHAFLWFSIYVATCFGNDCWWIVALMLAPCCQPFDINLYVLGWSIRSFIGGWYFIHLLQQVAPFSSIFRSCSPGSRVIDHVPPWFVFGTPLVAFSSRSGFFLVQVRLLSLTMHPTCVSGTCHGVMVPFTHVSTSAVAGTRLCRAKDVDGQAKRYINITQMSSLAPAQELPNWSMPIAKVIIIFHKKNRNSHCVGDGSGMCWDIIGYGLVISWERVSDVCVKFLLPSSSSVCHVGQAGI